jgi:hypothetical protein
MLPYSWYIWYSYLTEWYRELIKWRATFKKFPNTIKPEIHQSAKGLPPPLKFIKVYTSRTMSKSPFLVYSRSLIQFYNWFLGVIILQSRLTYKYKFISGYNATRLASLLIYKSRQRS